MSYTDSPACRLLASHCCVCGRPLVDSISVELGIGPDCRDQYAGGISPELQAEANKLTFEAAIAAQQGQVAQVETIAGLLRVMGLSNLADAIGKRFVNAERQAKITIEAKGTALYVHTPYRRGQAAEFVQAWRVIPGRRWDRDAGCNTVPVSSKAQLWALLCEFFPGAFGRGPKGLFRVPTSKES